MSSPAMGSPGDWTALTAPSATHASTLSEEGILSLRRVLETAQNVDIPSAAQEESSWFEVLNTMRAAREEHYQKARRASNSVHGNKSMVTTLEALSDMVPDQNGLSVLRGGLKLIFKLIQRRIENKERIMSAFEDIPLILSRACEALHTHDTDILLRQHVMGLLSTLLEEIPKLVNILSRRHKGSVPSRLFKQHPEHEASVISASTESVLKASRKVSDRVDTLIDKTVVENLNETKSIRIKVIETLDEAKSVGIKAIETQKGIQLLYAGLTSIEANQKNFELKREEEHIHTLDALSKVIDSRIESATSRLHKDLQTLQGLLIAPLMDTTHYLESPQTSFSASRAKLQWLPCIGGGGSLTSAAHDERSSENTYYNDMFLFLRLPDPGVQAKDIDQVLRATATMHCHIGQPLKRAGWLLVTPRFQHWIQPGNGTSDFILVNGNLGDVTEDKISALSLLGAMFINLRHAPHLLVLHHFCGLHAYRGEPGNGPLGLIQSLVGQLIMYLDRNVDALGPIHYIAQAVIHEAAHGDLIAFCMLFRELFRRLPSDTVVYCILDNVSEFETSLEEWGSQLCDVVDFLQFLMREGLTGPVLKVLATAAQRSIMLNARLEPECQIWLNADNRLP